jgi:DNA-binding NtrC family response regulator
VPLGHAEAGKPVPELEPDAMTCLMRYRWPGNIRELQNAIQRAIILCRENRLTTKDLPLKVAGYDTSPRRAIEAAVDRRLSLGLLEREYVRAVLESVNGNKRDAAAILQIDRKTLYRKLEDPQSSEQSALINKAEERNNSA